MGLPFEHANTQLGPSQSTIYTVDEVRKVLMPYYKCIQPPVIDSPNGIWIISH